jgi:outer membrane biogenesis lipoprotein LolB
VQLSIWARVSKDREKIMRPLQFVLIPFIAFILIGCGAGHPNLTSIAVSPQTATAESATHQQVGYEAQGHFSDGSSRALTQVDGLSWKTSTAAASIGSTGAATCLGPGTVTVTASAPQNLQLTVNNGVSNTSATIQGTAQLVCQ